MSSTVVCTNCGSVSYENCRCKWLTQYTETAAPRYKIPLPSRTPIRMPPSAVVYVLEQHNRWCRGDDTIEPEAPSILGEAIDEAVRLIKQLGESK